MNKKCSKCNKIKDSIEDFYKNSGNVCKECRKAYRRDWNEKSKERLKAYRKKSSAKNTARAVAWNKANPDRRKEIALNYYYRLQHQAIEAYGGYKCACCDETEPLFLTLDHIDNDGNAFRKKHGFHHHGSKFYKWLRDNNYPPGYQVLCSNCNHGKHRNKGICPHQET